MEHLPWGLDIRTIDPTHKHSIVKFPRSMATFSTGCGWTLVPTEETLAAMDALQVHNPISERKSFLTEFSARKYEYIFVPLYTEVDFFVLEPGHAPQRFSAPYTDFPLVTSSANPFFVTFYSRPKILRIHEPASNTWHRHFGDIKIHWSPFPLPKDFLRSCYPATLVTLSEDDSEPEPEHEVLPLKSKPACSSNEIVVPLTPGHFYAGPPPRKLVRDAPPVEDATADVCPGQKTICVRLGAGQHKPRA
ncbi:hypothetical protein DFH06DRAFT_269893 [Mycena polygramma]|nr:hypothetical protein DFH06DRAFT_269893 [Mycena polygramma]